MLEGCEWHGQTRELVRARWDDASARTVPSGLTLVACPCCDGPALSTARMATDEQNRVLAGGVCDPTRCSRCASVTPEQEAELEARLWAGYPR